MQYGLCNYGLPDTNYIMTNLELDRKFAITAFQIQRSFRVCVKLHISENTLPEAVPCAVHFSAKPINPWAGPGILICKRA